MTDEVTAAQDDQAARYRRSCCADCVNTGRTNPIDRARHHAELAQRCATQATRHAEEAARRAKRARRGNIVATDILVPLSLIALALALVGLFDG